MAIPLAIPLIGLHAMLGEIGGMLFIWVFVELLNPTENRLKRAQIVSLLGVIILFLSWIVGGFYYVQFYGPLVKPVIKSGPLPWAHSIITETKEHVFIFLPILAVLVYGLIKNYQLRLLEDKKLKVALLMLVGLVVLITFSMAGMGYVMSSGFRSALETISL